VSLGVEPRTARSVQDVDMVQQDILPHHQPGGSHTRTVPSWNKVLSHLKGATFWIFSEAKRTGDWADIRGSGWRDSCQGTGGSGWRDSCQGIKGVANGPTDDDQLPDGRHTFITGPVLVAAHFKAQVCGRSPAGVVGLNPTKGMDVL
jgi:hypothetical protein